MKVKKLLILIAMFTMSTLMQAQNSEVFKPYKQTQLRLPAVPILSHDPYFSIWSPYDKLNHGNLTHWSPRQKPLEGLLRVDGTVYRFMGVRSKLLFAPIAPMGADDPWTARYTQEQPAEGWEQPGFNDAAWKEGEGAFGTSDNPQARTRWEGDDANVYIRRVVTLTKEDLAKELYLLFAHDDNARIFINGKLAVNGKGYRSEGRLALQGALKEALHEGENIIAMHGHNLMKGALADVGIYSNAAPVIAQIKQANQLSVDVLATNTYYSFECGPVQLDLVFTAPMLIDDLDLLSTPINYISYQVRSRDGQAHDVQFSISADPAFTKHTKAQPTVSSVEHHQGVSYLKTGTIDQPILASKGDSRCIDWGYLYIPAINGEVSLSSGTAYIENFVKKGCLAPTEQEIVSRRSYDAAALTYQKNFGKVKEGSSYMLIGYDEIYDIEYMYHRYKGYWARDGKTTIFDAFAKLHNGYDQIMARCRALDKRIYDDALASGNVKYAEVLSASYRQVMAAHKLFEDKDGNLLYFSKENASNGCVNTVDLTYPSAPIYLIYNPELEKAMMTSIFEYSRSGRWTKPFAAHDLGTYPIANGQVYEHDMPLEEAGNMLTLMAQIAMIEGNTQYAERYWDLLQTWTDYLVENGQDPTNQLCTDDFAGHWAHNSNLAVKAIMGVAAFAELARMKGDKATANRYLDIARKMGKQWEKDAIEGDHYKLAYDRDSTWSQKYNIIWDQIWGTKVFSQKVIDREIKYYLTKQNKYGLPLDCRKDYTKTDWIMWTAAMAPDTETFLKFADPVYTYINETPSRVPISDWSDTKTGKQRGFKARSVIGGYWMKVLVDKLNAKK